MPRRHAVPADARATPGARSLLPGYVGRVALGTLRAANGFGGYFSRAVGVGAVSGGEGTACTARDEVAAALRGSRSAAPLRGGREYYCGRLSVCRAQLTELSGAPLGRLQQGMPSLKRAPSGSPAKAIL